MGFVVRLFSYLIGFFFFLFGFCCCFAFCCCFILLLLFFLLGRGSRWWSEDNLWVLVSPMVIPRTYGVLIRLRSSGLVASVFICWAVLSALVFVFAVDFVVGSRGTQEGLDSLCTTWTLDSPASWFSGLESQVSITTPSVYSVGDKTQDFAQAGQALYRRSHAPQLLPGSFLLRWLRSFGVGGV